MVAVFSNDNDNTSDSGERRSSSSRSYNIGHIGRNSIDFYDI
jgi:hypothetical protein